MTTKVLVTGSRGLLGSQLAPDLRDCGYRVQLHARAGAVDIRADLSDVAQVRAALDEAQPDVIVNLAALANVDECEKSPHAAYLANVRIVENLSAWILAGGSRCHLVHLSTDQVYDGPGLHREADLKLTNYYGFSKYAGELAAAAVPSTVLRTNFFGPSRCLGKSSLSDWVVRALRGADPVTVFEDVRFSPLAMRSVSGLLVRVIEKRASGVFNLGSREGLSKADFAFSLARVLGLPPTLLRRGTSGDARLHAYRPKNMCMDCSRFESAFGVQLPTLPEEIESMRAAYES